MGRIGATIAAISWCVAGAFFIGLIATSRDAWPAALVLGPFLLGLGLMMAEMILDEWRR